MTFTSGSAQGASVVLLGSSLLATPVVSGTAPPVNYPLDTDTTAAIGLLPGPNCPIGLLNVPLGNILEVCAITASTAGALGATPHLNSANSNVTIAGAALGTGPVPLLTLNAVNVQCKADGDNATGSTSLVASLLGAVPLLNGPLGKNVGITVPGIAEVLLNEQYDEIHTAPVGATPGTNSIKVNAARITLLDSTEIILGHVECTATGPDVNAPATTVPTTVTTVPTTVTTQPTATTVTTQPTATTVTTQPTATTVTTQPTATTVTTQPTATTVTTQPTATTVTTQPTATTVTTQPTATTAATTTTAPVASGTTLPLATTTTIKPVVAPPLARTGSNLMPMVTLALLAIALGTLVRRSAGMSPVPQTVVDMTPPTEPEFRPIDNRPSALRRRTRRSPLDPATSDALSAFEADDDDPDPAASG